MRHIKLFPIFIVLLFLSPIAANAHPMPNSVILMDIKGNKVNIELQLPLNELELAFGHGVNQHSDGLVKRLGPQLRTYILGHIHPVGPDGKPWEVTIEDMIVQPVQQSDSGPYKELTVHLTIVPPTGFASRKFTFGYDVIIHQVITHYALVSVRQDWDNGQTSEHPYEIGIVRLDIPNNTIPPLEINVKEGNLWNGFMGMLNLGMDHIKEGTDHLLFLLTLLLPATLLAGKNKWLGFGGTRYSLGRIVRIVTAFTIGHSLTLLIGAFGLIRFPGQPIEILIAISILVSAIHAYRPIFPGKEIFIAGGFGLIHGMAFAGTLVNLQLDMGRTALSILGFNLGIELMQLLVIAITIPWLIILSRNNAYQGLRIAGAVIAAVASIALIVERVTGESNLISDLVTSVASCAIWIILLLALVAIASYFMKKKTQPRV